MCLCVYIANIEAFCLVPSFFWCFFYMLFVWVFSVCGRGYRNSTIFRYVFLRSISISKYFHREEKITCVFCE